MNYIYKFICLLIAFFFTISCSEKVTYSGVILNNDISYYEKLKNKQDIISNIGEPNYIDPIENNYYYFSEQKKVKNFYKQKIIDRKMIVFSFDESENVIEFSHYNLNDKQDIEYIKDKTPNEIVKKGLIQKIFGGVGTNMPQNM